VEIVPVELGQMSMVQILVMLVITLVNVVTEETITNVILVTLVCTYITTNVSTLAQMVIILMKTPDIVNYVTDPV
jgi:hypothetical protein